MGMQVSCGVHPEVSAQGDVWVDTPRAGADRWAADISGQSRWRQSGVYRRQRQHVSLTRDYILNGFIGELDKDGFLAQVFHVK
jgi:hypothetical protein